MYSHLNHYLRTLRLQRTSERTIEGIINDIGHFFWFLKERKIRDIKAVTKKTIDDYQTYLYYYRYKGYKKLSNETQIKRLSILRTFFRYLLMEGLLLFNPAADIELPRRTETLPRDIFTKKELNKLFAACNLNTVYGYRDRVIFEVLYTTGIRITELASLKIEDIDLKDGYLRIIEGKGLKDRTVPLGKLACGYLSEYIKNVRPYLIKNSHSDNVLFLSRSGRAMDRFALLKMFGAYRKRIKLEKHLTGHCFRHTMATELLKRGADIRQIQEILGHESLSTTQKYVHVIQDDLKKVHAKTHPREKDITKDIHYKGEATL